MLRTGKIQRNVDKAIQRNNKIFNYSNMRTEILTKLNECASFLIEEHTYEERLPYLQKLDCALADLWNCYPDLNQKLTKNIKVVRATCNREYFMYIEIIKPLNDIISMLRMEVIEYHD